MALRVRLTNGHEEVYENRRGHPSDRGDDPQRVRIIEVRYTFRIDFNEALDIIKETLHESDVHETPGTSESRERVGHYPAGEWKSVNRD